MRSDQLIDIVQAATLITVSLGVVYAVIMLRRELIKVVAGLAPLFRTQREMEERIERLWKRIDELEMRQDPAGNMMPLPSLQAALQEILERLDRLEKKGQRKPRQPPQQKISWTRSRKR